MSGPADWGAVPVESPASWGAVPDKPEIDTPQNRATIARRNREGAAEKAFQTSVAMDTQPGLFARMGRGMLDIGQGVNQALFNLGDAIGGNPAHEVTYNPKTGQNERVPLSIPSAKDYTAQVNSERQTYDQSRTAAGETGIDWARMFGLGAASAPTALLAPEVAGPAWLARGVQGAVAGGTAGAAEFAPTNTLLERGKNAAVGAATGAVVAPVAGAVGTKAGQLYQSAVGRAAGAGEYLDPTTAAQIIKQVPEIASAPAEVQSSLIAEAQAQLKQTGTLNAEQLARKANLLAQGGVDPATGKPIFVTPTKSMVTRDAADWTRERNLQKLAQSPDEELSGTGRNLTGIYESNDKAFTAALAKQGAGLPGGTQEAHGMTVMKSADDLAKLSQEDVTKVYNDVRATHGNELASDAKNVTDMLAHPDVADNAYSEPIINSVTKRLKRYGMIGEDGNPTTNTMTVTQADEFRKFLGTLKSGDPKTDRIVTMLIKANDQDVLTGAGSNVMAPARATASARFNTLDNPATQRALNAYGELNQGKTAQNFIQTNIINGADQDVASLLDTLGKLPPEQAKTATDAIKAGVVRHLQDKAINENSGQFSGAKLNSALNDIGDTKLARIFGMKSAQELRDLARAGLDATYQPPYSAVNNSNTTPMLLSLTRGARMIPGVPLLVSEEAQKAAARIGYAGQFKDIRAAQSTAPKPEIPDILNQIAGLLPRTAGPVGAVGVQQQSR